MNRQFSHHDSADFTSVADEDALRIGITGSAGVGKTTLAFSLAATLGVPAAAEVMRSRMEAGFSLHHLSKPEHQALLQKDADDLAVRLNEGWGLVCDRTPMDFFAFWLCNGYGADDPQATAAFHQRVMAAMTRFDLVLVLPWGAIPLADDGVRFANPWHQLHAQAMIEGLCQRYVVPQRLAVLPMSVVDPEERCRWVLKRLGLPA